MRINTRFNLPTRATHFRPTLRHVCAKVRPQPKAHTCPGCALPVGIPDLCGLCEDAQHNSNRDLLIAGA